MNTIIYMITSKLLPKILVIGLIGASALTTGVAAFKIAQELPPVEPIKNILIAEPVIESGSAMNQNPIPSTMSKASTTSQTVSVVAVATGANKLLPGLPVISLTQLAAHNKAGDCWVDYDGTVYDVSNYAAWNGCYHNGIIGGMDITSRFPHPVSYLATIPVRARIEGTSTATIETGKKADNNANDHENDVEQDRSEFEKKLAEQDKDANEKTLETIKNTIDDGVAVNNRESRND